MNSSLISAAINQTHNTEFIGIKKSLTKREITNPMKHAWVKVKVFRLLWYEPQG